MTGHIRQRSPGSWEIKFDAVTDPATGKRKARFVTVRGARKTHSGNCADAWGHSTRAALASRRNSPSPNTSNTGSMSTQKTRSARRPSSATPKSYGSTRCP